MMEKTIEISGQKVTFKSSGAVPKRYKAYFGRDFFKDLFAMSVNGGSGEISIENMDFDVFYDIAWTLAKTADSTTPEVIEWLDGFEEFPIVDIIPEIQDILTATMTSKKKLTPPKPKRAGTKAKQV